MRAVLDANVLVSALLSRSGAPARLITSWLAGEFELVLSETLLAEMERTFTYPKIRKRIAADDAERFLALLRDRAELVPDSDEPASVRSSDPDDDYLLGLASQEQVFLVSGDAHLLGLGERLPILSPRQFLDELQRA